MGATARRFRLRTGSFKVRLVAWFLLISLVPLLGSFWAFGHFAVTSETGRADVRLSGALRVAVADFEDRISRADETAASVAQATAFQQALAIPNRGELTRLYRQVPNAAFYVDGQLVAGSRPPALAVKRRAPVLDERGARLGHVVVSVPLDDDLIAELRSENGFENGDELALVSDGRVIVGPKGLAASKLPRRRVVDLELGEAGFRALTTRLPGTRATLVALAPKSRIEARAGDLRLRLVAFGAIALVAAAALAYALGLTIVRSLKHLVDAAGAVARGNFTSRVPVRGRDEFAALASAFNDMAVQLEARLEELAWERARGRDAIARFGEALAATHNPYVLLPVIVESIVEATGAAGGRLIVDGEEIANAGNPDGGTNAVEIRLGDEYDDGGVLLLTPSGPELTEEARELAHWLASQAWTALENARLHIRLEREAVTDGLTDLPNRRQFEDSLAGELSRVERFGGSLGLIVADLDDFKQVNDRYGHLAGDDVLRAFADVLRETVREIDVPARYGGEEFAVLLPQTDLYGGERVAERIRAALEERAIETFPGAVLNITASFGVAAFPDSPTEAALFAAADDALYRAKAGGKNRVATAGAGEAVRRNA